MSPSRKHSSDEILAAAVETAFDGGLSQLSFGRVARRLGIADRTVVYYFPTIGDLVASVVVSLGVELQSLLAPAFAEGDRVAYLGRAGEAPEPAYVARVHSDDGEPYYTIRFAFDAGRERQTTAAHLTRA